MLKEIKLLLWHQFQNPKCNSVEIGIINYMRVSQIINRKSVSISAVNMIAGPGM